MGGASALAEADRDERVDAVIVESTHAALANAAQARLDASGYPLSMPGSWAILLGTLIRTGEDVSAVDPVQTVERLDDRPLLLIHAGSDGSIGPDDAEAMLAAAEAAGSPTELDVCPGAAHAESLDTCPEDFRRLGARLPRARPGTGQLRRSDPLTTDAAVAAACT